MGLQMWFKPLRKSTEKAKNAGQDLVQSASRSSLASTLTR